MSEGRAKNDTSRVPLATPLIELRVAFGTFRDCKLRPFVCGTRHPVVIGDR